MTRRRTERWVALGLIAITAVAVISAWFTAPRLGGRMDPASTSPLGAHGLVSLLRDRGVEVIVAATADEAKRAVGPDTLLLIADTYYLRGEEPFRTLAEAPGDRLVLEPTARAREALSPGARLSREVYPTSEPDCDLREANRAGVAQLEDADTYSQAGNDPVTRCYGGALVRYREGARTITVVGTADFMTNSSLLKEGNAALAMNLAGGRPRLVWFAPQHMQGSASEGATIADLVPDAFFWVAIQLCLVVVLLAMWQGRRLGPLVAERLPVVVRASETVEGRARLYRSRRARDQAAAALRTAALHRMSPRLGLGPNRGADAVLAAVARRCPTDENSLRHLLFGPPPTTDSELVQLAKALDHIERQVSQS